MYEIRANEAQLKKLEGTRHEFLFFNYPWKSHAINMVALSFPENQFKEAKEVFVTLEMCRITVFKSWPNE